MKPVPLYCVISIFLAACTSQSQLDKKYGGEPEKSCTLGNYFEDSKEVLDKRLDTGLDNLDCEYVFDETDAKYWADKGYPEAQNYYGTMLLFGESVKKNEKAALKWFLKAAEAKDDNALSNIGYMYSHALGGLPLDYVKSREYFEMAVENGNGAAALYIALYHLDGKGVDVDGQKSMDWLLRSAQLKHKPAYSLIGNHYYFGKGIDVNYKEAKKWYLKAATYKDSMAINNLGNMFENGHGIEIDNAKAYVLYKLAASLGSETAKEGMNDVEEKLSREDLEQINILLDKIRNNWTVKDFKNNPNFTNWTSFFN